MTVKRNILIEADKLLLNHEVTELPITFDTLKRIADRSGWLLASYQHSPELLESCGAEQLIVRYPAFTLKHNNNVVILYDEELPYEVKVQLICHEIGHNNSKNRIIKSFMSTF